MPVLTYEEQKTVCNGFSKSARTIVFDLVSKLAQTSTNAIRLLKSLIKGNKLFFSETKDLVKKLINFQGDDQTNV